MVPCKPIFFFFKCSHNVPVTHQILQEILIPWYHYVPTKLDYSDVLYVILHGLICLPLRTRQTDELSFLNFCWESSDTLAFFQGSPDGSIPGRDDLAKEIAGHAYKFVQERWREEDMRSFMYLLILEVSRFFFSHIHQDLVQSSRV